MTRRAVVLLVAVSLGLLGITAAVWQYGAAQYAAGRASVAIPVLDTTATAAAARYADSTRAHVDTVLVRVTRTRYAVDTIIVQIPDTIRLEPSVAALIATVTTLTAQVDTLTHAVDVAQAAARMQAAVDRAALTTAYAHVAERDAAIATLSRRPTWRRAMVSTVAGAAVAFAAGVWR
jgi:hypothetical protein